MTAAGKAGGFTAFWQAPYRPLFLAMCLCPLWAVAWWPLATGFGLPGPSFESTML